MLTTPMNEESAIAASAGMARLIKDEKDEWCIEEAFTEGAGPDGG